MRARLTCVKCDRRCECICACVRARLTCVNSDRRCVCVCVCVCARLTCVKCDRRCVRRWLFSKYGTAWARERGGGLGGERERQKSGGWSGLPPLVADCAAVLVVEVEAAHAVEDGAVGGGHDAEGEAGALNCGELAGARGPQRCETAVPPAPPGEGLCICS